MCFSHNLSAYLFVLITRHYDKSIFNEPCNFNFILTDHHDHLKADLDGIINESIEKFPNIKSLFLYVQVISNIRESFLY